MNLFIPSLYQYSKQWLFRCGALFNILAGNNYLHAQLQLDAFEKYTTLNGLSSHQIHTITQDSLGFIWIGTRYGLNRFDGTDFVNFTALNHLFVDEEQLITKLTYLNGHELGISTVYGAYILSTRDYQFSSFRIPSADPLKYWASYTYDIIQDAKRNYGVSTKTGLYVYSASHTLIDQLQFYSEADIGIFWMLYGREMILLPDGNMMQKNSAGFNVYDADHNAILKNPPINGLDTSLINADPDMDVLRLSDGRIAFFSVSQKKLVLQDLSLHQQATQDLDENLLKNLNWNSKLCQQNDSTLLLSGKQGLYEIRYTKNPLTVFIHPEVQLPELPISSLFVDRDQRLWLGTLNGLFKQSTAPILKKHSLPSTIGGSIVRINWIEPGSNVLYLATSNHGLLTLDASSYALIARHKPELNHESVSLGKIFTYAEDELWICTNHGVVRYSISTGKSEPLAFDNCPACLEGEPIYEIYRDDQGNVWLSGGQINTVFKIDPDGGTITRITNEAPNDRFRVNVVFRFTQDAEGYVWFCGDAMARYNLERQQVDSLIEKLPLQRNFKKTYFAHLNSDREFWIYTNGDNWHVLHPDQRFEVITNEYLKPHINPHETLIDDFLYYISADNKIVLLNTRTRLFQRLSIQDGWGDEKISTQGFSKNPVSSHILFAADHLVYEFSAPATNPHQPSAPIITEIYVNGKQILYQPKGSLSFGPRENTLEIKFSNFNFTDPENQLFTYRLSGRREASWITTERPEIILTQIPPGNYVLEVKLASRNNFWPEAIYAYPIKIRLPFYRQWRFVLPAILASGVMILLLFRYRIRQVRTISSLDKLVVEYELKALHAQMNPHFVFNCLNSIKELIMSKDNKNANIYLNKFSYLLRSTLDQSKLPFVTLTQVIEYLRHYLDMEKLRFDHFAYTIEIDPALNTETIGMTPMLLQPIVENAVWHGNASRKAASQVHIRFYTREECIICEVEDYGVGIYHSSPKKGEKNHKPTALLNIQKRIELLNKKTEANYQLIFIDKSEQSAAHGTIVRLSFKQSAYELD